MIAIGPAGKKSRIWNGLSGFPRLEAEPPADQRCNWPTRKRYITPVSIAHTHTEFNWPKFATQICGTIVDLKFPPYPSTEATKPRRENKSFQIDFTLTTHLWRQIISKESLPAKQQSFNFERCLDFGGFAVLEQESHQSGQDRSPRYLQWAHSLVRRPYPSIFLLNVTCLQCLHYQPVLPLVAPPNLPHPLLSPQSRKLRQNMPLLQVAILMWENTQICAKPWIGESEHCGRTIWTTPLVDIVQCAIVVWEILKPHWSAIFNCAVCPHCQKLPVSPPRETWRLMLLYLEENRATAQWHGWEVLPSSSCQPSVKLLAGHPLNRTLCPWPTTY